MTIFFFNFADSYADFTDIPPSANTGTIHRARLSASLYFRTSSNDIPMVYYLDQRSESR
jgi:hypothetical protein